MGLATEPTHSLAPCGLPITVDAVIGIANVHAKGNNYKQALQLLPTSIPHPAIIPTTKVRAQKLITELKTKLSAEEMKSAQAFAARNTVESIARNIDAN